MTDFSAQREDAMTTAPTDAPRRVLIVDDNEDAALSLGAFFELQGHTVAVCHDGLAAVEVAARFRPKRPAGLRR